MEFRLGHKSWGKCRRYNAYYGILTAVYAGQPLKINMKGHVKMAKSMYLTVLVLC